jgi:hypothetical protein
MNAEEIKRIVAAVKARRGGLEQAIDQQVLMIWQSLTPQDQAQYLSTTKSKSVER